ncbi:MAG: hypothetical protein QXD66_03055 [Candidatus Nezhaarchaeales archaeon]|nr:MAG: hypothetical protein DSO06_01725 [Candidatus Nezhaarchaeota archaeon WYZ-LMO8]TDA36955.1 MAG: hypothetical protein DSO05_01725 [Candidatus Nezhaarchaeota archaeon WYZ-LMO7]
MEDLTKSLADLKKYLEERLSALTIEVEHLKLLIKLVDDALAKVSFKPASALEVTKEVIQQVPQPVQPRSLETETLILASSRMGNRLLGKMYIGEGYLRIVPVQDVEFNVNIPPFRQFLIEKVLEEMRKKDREATERGEMKEDEVMDYEVRTKGDILVEIFVKNITDERRVRELKNAVRWTFERMLEKISQRSS